MIIDNTYFKGDIFIHSAKPSITSDSSDIASELVEFIDLYSKDCLRKCLGISLFNEFKAVLDPDSDTGLIENPANKWVELLNGVEEYTDARGKKKFFKGIRYKTSDKEDAEYNKSFLANYVYYFYEEADFIKNTGVGNIKPKAKSAEVVTPRFKVISSWRKFIKDVQGSQQNKEVIHRRFGFGIDHYNNSQESCLYTFIKDMNEIDPDNYKDFEPFIWRNANQFDI